MEIHGIRALVCIFPMVLELAQVTGTLGFREGRDLCIGRTRFAALFSRFSPFVICSIYLRAEHREVATINSISIS